MSNPILQLVSANKLFQAHEGLLSTPRLSPAAKVLMYKVFIRPILSHGCQTWVLTSKLTKKLLEFEKAVLRKIFADERLTDKQLYDMYTDVDIINYAKVQRIKWVIMTQSRKSQLRHIMKKFSINKDVPSRYYLRDWLESVEQDMEYLGIDNRQLASAAKDKNTLISLIDKTETAFEK